MSSSHHERGRGARGVCSNKAPGKGAESRHHDVGSGVARISAWSSALEARISTSAVACGSSPSTKTHWEIPRQSGSRGLLRACSYRSEGDQAVALGRPEAWSGCRSDVDRKLALTARMLAEFGASCSAVGEEAALGGPELVWPSQARPTWDPKTGALAKLRAASNNLRRISAHFRRQFRTTLRPIATALSTGRAQILAKRKGGGGAGDWRLRCCFCDSHRCAAEAVCR